MTLLYVRSAVEIHHAFGVLLMLTYPLTARAQDNYEIQVYGADTVAPKTIMFELHSNYTVDGFKPVPGSRYQADGTFPTKHTDYETVEITAGVTK